MKSKGLEKTATMRILLMLFVLLCFSINISFALPSGETVVSGSASFDRSTPNTLKINTSSDKLIVDYNSFSIGTNESVYFYQPSASSMALNRVTGSDISNINGSLIANGIIYLINGNGINIGPNANINAAGFIASTLNIANVDFMNNNFVFTKLADKIGRSVINNGYIRVRETGQVALLGSAVANAGTIETSLGSVVLAAGEKITLNLDTAGMISVVINKPVQEEIFGPGGEKLSSAVSQSGKILNPGGRVILAAKVLNNVFDYAVNNTGIVQAQSLVNHNGVVELVAEGAPILNAGTVEATKVEIAAKAAPVTNTGEIKANEVTVVSEAAPVFNKGRIEAQKLSVSVTGSDFINEGQIVATSQSGALGSGNIAIQAINILQGGLISAAQTITLNATGVVEVPYIMPVTNQNLGVGQPIGVNPGIIIQANEVRVIAKQFGTNAVPLNISANTIYIGRALGNIDIMDSLGIGSSVLVRGPPGGFGAIYYNKDANLKLQAAQINLVSSQAYYFYGDITFSSLTDLNPNSYIYFQAGKTYTILGDLTLQGAFGELLNLRSSVDGAQWMIDPQGARNIAFISVKDSNNINPAEIVADTSNNELNNINWDPTTTWTGNGANNNWSTGGNWNTGVAPPAGNDVTFTGAGANGNKNSTVDAGFGGTILSLNTTGYTGTITLARSLTITNTLTLGGGTLDTSASNFALTAGTISIGASGTLNANGSTITLTATSGGARFTNSGTFNVGTSTVAITGDANETLTSGAATFYNLSLSPTITANRTYTFGAGAITINNNFTINPTRTSGGSRALTVNMGAAITVTGTTTVTETGASATSNLSTTASNFALSTGSLNVATGATLTANASTITLTGTSGTLFTRVGTFTQGTSVVNVSSTGSVTLNSGIVTFATLKINDAAGVTLGATITTTTLTIGDVTANSIFNDGGFQVNSTGTLNLTSGTFKLGSAGAATTFPAFATRNISSGTTVEYAAGVAQTVSTTPSYQNLTFSGAGTKTTASGTLSIAGSWSVGSTTALNTNNTVVNLTGDLSGSGNITQGTGLITVAGNWLNTGTFTASSAGVTLTGSSKQITGSASGITFTTLTVNGTYTNNNTTGLTVSTALSGSGTLTQGVNAVLNISGTSGITGLVASASGNTVNYNGAGAQTVKPVAYYNLTLSNSGAKSMGSVTTISNNLNISGSATMTGNAGFTVTGALNYSSSGTTTLTAATPISIGQMNQTAGIIVDNGNTITVTGTGASTWVESGTFTATGTVVFTGAAPQIGASGFNNLTINVGGGNTTSLAGSVTVGGTLTLTSGTFAVGANSLTLNGPAIAGTATNLSTTSSSNLSFGASSTNVFIPSSVTSLNNLTINNANNVILNSNITLSGSLTLTSGKLKITVSATGINKPYDGTNIATVSLSSFKITSDVFSFNYTATFASVNVGTGIIVNVNGISLTGANSGNYILANTTASTSANITPVSLSITANNASKTYGQTLTGGAGSIAFSSVGLQNGETIGSVTIAYGSGAAANANVGTYVGSVTPSAATGGTFSASNYNITYNSGNIVVNQASLSITANNASKTYGQTVAFSGTEFTSSGLKNGETIGSVTLTSAGAASTAGVAGSPYAITPSDATGGTFNPANYTITSNNGSLTVNQKDLMVSGITANNKVFNGTTTATLNTAGASLVGVVAGDTVVLDTAGAAGNFPDASIGTGKLVTISGLTISGLSASNYSLIQPTATANITGVTAPTPANPIINSQISNADTSRRLLPNEFQLREYQINTFLPAGPAYLYHPLTPNDASAFDKYILNSSDYNLNGTTLNFTPNGSLIPFLEGLKRIK